MIKGLSVRKAMSRLRNKTAEQRQAVSVMHRNAEALTASGRALTKAKNGNPPPLCFVEVAGEGDLQRSFFSDGMLSGVAIGVADTLDVREFRTRYGCESQLLHQLPHTEFAFVSWLRRHGAQFVGKLACQTPFALGEASILVPECPAAVAVSQKACNYAISSALIGPAAMTSPLHYDVVSFKPTAQSIATFTGSHRLGIPSMSIGITAERLDDIFYLWEVFTSAIQPSYFQEEAKKEWGAGGAGGEQESGGSSNNKTNNSNNSSSSSNSSGGGSNVGGGGGLVNSNSGLSVSSNNVSNSAGGGLSFTRGSQSRLNYRKHNAFATHTSSGSGEKLFDRHIELCVGYPSDWIDSFCQERVLSADEFRRRILCLASTRNAMRNNELLDVIPLTLDIDLEAVVKAIQTITLYELSQAFDRLFTRVGSDVSRELLTSQSGLLEELSEEVVSAIFHGRTLTTLDYHRALRTRDSVVRATEEQFRDVDLIVTPILSEPYVNSSLRSIVPLLPFSLGGNPMISLQLEPDFPVALIGELGRDTGLFEDCTTFLQFVRGTSPRWWRRKFMRGR